MHRKNVLSLLNITVSVGVRACARACADTTRLGLGMNPQQDDNNNVHLSCAYQRPERSHDTY